jgi:hypothetical protein
MRQIRNVKADIDKVVKFRKSFFVNFLLVPLIPAIILLPLSTTLPIDDNTGQDVSTSIVGIGDTLFALTFTAVYNLSSLLLTPVINILLRIYLSNFLIRNGASTKGPG